MFALVSGSRLQRWRCSKVSVSTASGVTGEWINSLSFSMQ
jgi:hypothetical protein